MKTQTFTLEKQSTHFFNTTMKLDVVLKISLFAAILTCVNLMTFL